MKTLFSKLFFISIALMALNSCSKDQAMDTFNGGSAPTLTADKTTTIPLAYINKDNEAITLTWTNPNYQFASGTSSQDVAYTIEIDTSGANFTNPQRQVLSVSKDLSLSITQSVFNGYLLNQLQLDTLHNHNIEIRVSSTIGGVLATKLVSNVLKFSVKPYSIPPVVQLPASGQLFLVGSATAGGWNNPVPVPSQQFTKVSNTQYTITVPLIGGQEYLLLPVNGDWNQKYAVPDKTVSGLNAGGDFKFYTSGGDNFPGPSASGTYKIDVDFQRGKFTVTKQ